jgi:hypothetical protein
MMAVFYQTGPPQERNKWSSIAGRPDGFGGASKNFPL